MENSLDTRIQHAVIGDTNNAGKTTATDDKPLRGEIVFNNTLTNFRVGINGNTAYSSLPDFLHVFTGANTFHPGTSGLVLAPSQKSSGDPDKFLCDDGSWKAVSSSGGTDTTYKFYLNGTLTYGSDSGGTNLSSPDGTINGIYAPITSGTSGNMLKSNGNNSAPTWDSLENIIGKKTANYVLAGNGTASGNGVVSWQQLSLSSLSDAPNTGTLTLNGTGFSVYSPTASLSKTWYAPTTVGSSGDILVSNASGAPSWRTLTSYWVNFSRETISNVPYMRLNPYIKVSPTDPDSYTVSDVSGSVYNSNPTVYANEGLRFQQVTVSSGSYQNGFAIALNTATVNALGGIKLGMANVASGTFAYPGINGHYMPLQIDSNGRGWVWEPTNTLPIAQESVLGGLIVSSDTDADTGYRNLDSAVAVPVFYGNVSNMYTRDEGNEDYDMENPEKDVTIHYVNVRDVFNGIIRDQEMVIQLKAFLEWLMQHNPEEEWPWWDPKK